MPDSSAALTPFAGTRAYAVPVLTAPLRPLRRTLPFGQALLMAALPHGGQRLARRNAWGGMSSDAAVERSRRDADAAMRQAQSRAQIRAPSLERGRAQSVP